MFLFCSPVPLYLPHDDESRNSAPGHPAHHADSPVGNRAAKRSHGLPDQRPVPRGATLVPPSVREPFLPESGRRGRGALTNRSGRYEPQSRELVDDGWDSLDDVPPLKTQVTEETARHIVTRNSSPDIPFDRSINAYRGCEHGCVYCFARPTHAYMGLSPALDFESKLFAKPNAAQLLEKELAKPGYKVAPIAMGTNTDPYQPIEQRYAHHAQPSRSAVGLQPPGDDPDEVRPHRARHRHSPRSRSAISSASRCRSRRSTRSSPRALEPRARRRAPHRGDQASVRRPAFRSAR